MIELRKSPRVNVTWRGLIRVTEDRFLKVRAINVSSSGLLVLSEQALIVERDYHCMFEIPPIDLSAKQVYKVPCKIAVMHSILRGDAFRVGVRIVEISDLHQDLLNAWISLANRTEQAISS